ncbi:MAG TPA: hypothetical protein VGJ70_22215 [Solirubrobacteraceae bacterium]
MNGEPERLTGAVVIMAARSASTMSPKLPPPDPYESIELAPTGGHRVPAPTAVFVMGPASPETDRAADQFLDLRPGVLIVVARD